MTDLSPAAQAVLDAYQLAPIKDELTAAAVLRAAADQIRLDKALGETDADAGVLAAHHAIYAYLLAIAARLDAQ